MRKTTFFLDGYIRKLNEFITIITNSSCGVTFQSSAVTLMVQQKLNTLLHVSDKSAVSNLHPLHNTHWAWLSDDSLGKMALRFKLQAQLNHFNKHPIWECNGFFKQLLLFFKQPVLNSFCLHRAIWFPPPPHQTSENPRNSDNSQACSVNCKILPCPGECVQEHNHNSYMDVNNSILHIYNRQISLGSNRSWK